MFSRLQISAVLCMLALAPAVLQAATVTVTSTADTIAADGAVTLREAMTAINAGANAGDVVAVGAYGSADAINFNIPGAGSHTIVVTSELPAMSVPVLIDGYSEPGSSVNTLAVGNNAVLNIILDGVTRAFNGISFFAGSANSTVRGLVLQNFQVGVQLSTSNVLVAGNFIGTDAAGLAPAANQIAGVNVSNGNIGSNQIGTAAPADRNLISGNVGGGIIINSQQSNSVLGNYIGTTRSGLAPLPNGSSGIIVGTLGGVPLGAPIIGDSTATAGTGSGNVISGNGGFGIEIVANSGATVAAGGTIEGNLIGLGPDGVTTVANARSGITIFDTNLSAGGPASIGALTIGGGSALERNVISGNTNNGLLMIASGSTVQNNFIGTDISGTLARPNFRGVDLNGGGGFGGLTFLQDNVISGNSNHGVRIAVTTALVINNDIGTAVGGVTALGNNGFGILVDSASAQIINNTIANNGNNGVHVEIGLSVVRNASDALILGNSITNNAGIGINLNNGDIVTPNDAGDPDIGPNLLQNYPVITSAVIAGGNVTINGTLNSTPSSTFTVEFFSNAACDASGFGEGKSFLGSASVTTDAGGNATIGPLVFPITPGETVITSTASVGTVTSEFSACAPGVVVTPEATINNVTQLEGNSGTTAFTFTVSLSSPAVGTESVTYATADGTATAPTDYTAIPSGLVTFLPGATTATLTVNVNGDTAPESDETFTVNLTGGTGVTIGTPSTGTGTIQNDDIAVLPAATINSVTASEGNTGTTAFTFTVTLSAPATGTESVNYTTSDGTAVAPGDYTAVPSGVVNFAPGATTATLTINVNGDTSVEADETFTVILTGGSGVSIGVPATGTGTIGNDDAAPAPVATINSASGNEGNTGTTTLTFTVTLSAPASGTESVTYTTADGTATAPADYVAVAGGVASFAAGATTTSVTITVNADTTAETDETFTVTLTGGTGVTIGAPAQGTGTILNDDATVPGTNVPTTSEWMLLLIAASLAVVGLFAIRRV